MIKLTQKLSQTTPFDMTRIDATLSLPIDIRIRSRAHVQLDDGREAGLFLERGSMLRGGDLLSSDDGIVVKVIAAKENVSTVYCDDPLLLTKAAYHLGNRHVPLQIEQTWLRYQHDQILDGMLEQMGFDIKVGFEKFEPEAGAYQQQGESHHHHSHFDEHKAHHE